MPAVDLSQHKILTGSRVLSLHLNFVLITESVFQIFIFAFWKKKLLILAKQTLRQVATSVGTTSTEVFSSLNDLVGYCRRVFVALQKEVFLFLKFFIFSFSSFQKLYPHVFSFPADALSLISDVTVSFVLDSYGTSPPVGTATAWAVRVNKRVRRAVTSPHLTRANSIVVLQRQL